MQRFDIINERQQQSSSPDDPLLHKTNGTKREPKSESGMSDLEDKPSPKKKIKKQEPSIDDDARLAAALQAAESRARPSRSGVRKTPVKKRAPKKKSAAKIKGEDDSDLEDGSDSQKKPKVIKKTGFHKPYILSESLQALVEEEKLPRTQVVKKIWEHVHKYDLQDPTDKRQILCDEKMQAVFKVERLHMFTMNKLLGKHLYPCEDEPEAKVEDMVKMEDLVKDEDDDED